MVTALALAALVSLIPQAQAQDNAADLSVKSDQRDMANVMETYYADHGGFPRARHVGYDGTRTVTIGSENLRLGKGNRLGTIRLTKDREAYCLRVVRAKGASQTSSAWRYVSDRGGTQPGVCPPRFGIVLEG
jgi:hypothetical protein